MSGWQREIVDPFNALVAPWQLVWKEKYGLLRCEWLAHPLLRGLREVGPMAQVLEEASRLCCADCGRWNGWIRGEDKHEAVVENKPVRGWFLTLCQDCRKKAEEAS